VHQLSESFFEPRRAVTTVRNYPPGIPALRRCWGNLGHTGFAALILKAHQIRPADNDARRGLYQLNEL